jgi:hypothetical protein
MTTMHKTTSVLTGLILMSALVGVALAQGECSTSNPCAGGQCCSQFGFCGCSEAYCGQGCIDNCNGCDGRRENAHTMLTDGECSTSNPCQGGQCCSQFGFCGCSEAYCGQGCIDNCNGCDGRRKNAHTMLSDGECSTSNPCQGGQCCSQFGFCGCSDAYCGQGCIDNCNGCDGRLADSSSQATYYTTYVPSSCYGFDTSKFPPGNLIAAASTDVFGNREACGTYYEITCKGATSGGGNACKQNPTVKVMVVDLCPGCNKNSFDLSKEAFSKIADLDAGRINISAKRVSKYHKTREETITEVV